MAYSVIEAIFSPMIVLDTAQIKNASKHGVFSIPILPPRLSFAFIHKNEVKKAGSLYLGISGKYASVSTCQLLPECQAGNFFKVAQFAPE